MWRESLVAGVWGKQPHRIVSESAENHGEGTYLAHFLFSLSSGPHMLVCVLSHFGCVLSLNYPPLEIPLYNCFHGDSKSL